MEEAVDMAAVDKMWLIQEGVHLTEEPLSGTGRDRT